MGVNSLEFFGGDSVFDKNAKNKLLPFLVNRDSPNGIFSFRPSDIQKEKYGCINIFPSDRGMYKQDIGLKQIVSGSDKKICTLNTLLSHIPGIVIREYQQDTKIDTVFSLFKSLIDGFNRGKEDSSGSNQNTQGVIDTASFRAGYAFQALRSTKLWGNLIDKLNDETLVVKFVENLYFHSIGQQTTNWYTLPNNEMKYLESDGTIGFTAATGNAGGDFSMRGNSLLGKALNMIGGNISITMTPIWTFTGDPTSSISIKLSLFNDTLEHAINNFLFVNTLIPSNMSLTYTVYRFPPCTYDLKIEGGRRFMMCSGKFSCTNKGVLRTPSNSFINTIVGKFKNKSDLWKEKITKESVKNSRWIMIPDVYDLDLTFNSLLPDVFNTYILNFASISQFGKKNFNSRSAWFVEGGESIEKKISEFGNEIVNATTYEKDGSFFDGGIDCAKKGGYNLTTEGSQKEDSQKKDSQTGSSTTNAQQVSK